MPFVGLGLHLVLALVCAIHAVRSRQPMYWLIILFSFPMLGSLVYLFAVYLPASRLQRSARKAACAVVRSLDPTREVRAARAEYEYTPTVQNLMRLAAALLDVGEAEEAATLYARGLTGPFASDPDMRFGAARAFIGCRRFADALPHLEALRRERPQHRPESVALLTARCLAGSGSDAHARQAFEEAIERFGSFDAHAEYAIWALETGDAATASRLQAEIDRVTRRWNAANRALNEPTLRRLRAAGAG